MQRKFKFGDWADASTGQRIRFVSVNRNGDFMFVGCDGEICAFGTESLTYLPDCTGFDWKPPKPIEPPEGYRFLTVGEETKDGDLFLGLGGWSKANAVGGVVVRTDRPYARKIEKYRPFASAAEFFRHRNRWVRWKANNGTVNDSIRYRVHSYSDTVVWVGSASHGKDYQEALNQLEFEDGSPFGVKESGLQSKD